MVQQLPAGCLLFACLLGSSFADNKFVQHSFKPIVAGRIDPIISPGQISQHVHHVVGGSNFNRTYDPVKQRQAKCTNLQVQADKSNYWQPSIYRVLPNGSYVGMQTGTRIYYFMDKANTVFPDDHRMVAGDPDRKSRNAKAESDNWQFYNCNEQSWTLPKKSCQVLISKVFFPSCWNGKPYDPAQPRAHMRYPKYGFLGWKCPSGYPHRFPDVLMESFFFGADEGNTPSGRQQYILANGDTTGYGLHADFANGWDMAVANRLVKECKNPKTAEPANQACAPLAPSYSDTASLECAYQNEIPDEPIGMTHTLSMLPGCNWPWSKGPKPRCNLRMFRGNPRWIKPRKNVWQWSRHSA